MSVALAGSGHQVALLARSADKLESARVEAGDNAVAITCDVTDESSVRSAIGAAAEALGGIDNVIYTAAIGPISRIEDADADTWRRVFDTNVVGASLTMSAALPHLKASHGSALIMSTVGASYTPPWPGLSVYQVSKAAVERLVEAWRAEHPTVGFTRLTLGECGGGSGDSQSHFNNGWDPEVTMEIAPTWFARNLMSGALIDVNHLIAVVTTLVNAGSSLSVPVVVIASRPGPQAEVSVESFAP